MSLHRLAALVGTGVKPDAIPGMVVEHGQGMATTGGGREVAFEIHLPELVGPIALEADKGTWGGRVRLDAAVTAKDRRGGARGRNVLPIESDEAGMNLSASPCRMLLTQSKHLGLDVHWVFGRERRLVVGFGRRVRNRRGSGSERAPCSQSSD